MSSSLAAAADIVSQVALPDAERNPKNITKMPWSMRIAKIISNAGTIAAVATIIYGIAINVMGWIILGAIFLATSLSSYYLIHQILNMKPLEETTKQVQDLTDKQFVLSKQKQESVVDIRASSLHLKQTIAESNADAVKDARSQQQSSATLQKTAQGLQQAKDSAKDRMEETKEALAQQVADLKKQSTQDQKIIAELRTIESSVRQENVNLTQILTQIQTRITSYQKKIDGLIQINTTLTEQMSSFTSHSSSMSADEIIREAKALESAASEQRQSNAKLSKIATKIDKVLQRIQKK